MMNMNGRKLLISLSFLILTLNLATTQPVNEWTLEGDEGIVNYNQFVDNLYSNDIRSGNKKITDNELVTYNYILGCLKFSNSDRSNGERNTIGKCISHYQSQGVEITITPEEIIGQTSSEDDSTEKSSSENDNSPIFKVRRTAGNIHIVEFDQNKYEFLEAGKNYPPPDDKFPRFRSEKGATYSFVFRRKGSGASGDKRVTLQAPDFNMDGPEPPITDADSGYTVELKNYNGGSSGDRFNGVKNKIWDEDGSGSVKTENTDSDGQDSGGKEKAVVSTNPGVSTLSATVVDDTPSGGVAAIDSYTVLVGSSDGFVQDLSYPGGAYDMSEIKNDWNVYARKSSENHLKKEKEWDHWGPTTKKDNSWQDHDVVEIEADVEGSNKRKEVLINKTLDDDHSTDTFPDVKTVYFKAKSTTGNGKVLLRNNGARQASFSLEKGSDFKYYRIYHNEGKLEYQKADSLRKLVSGNPSSVNLDTSEGNNFDSIGFKTTTDGGESELYVSYIVTIR